MKENIIEIRLKNKDEFMNTYNNKRLSVDLANYILEESKNIKTKQKIKFIINTDFILTDKDKDTIVSMIRNSFGTDVSEIMNISRKESITNLIIFIIGLLFLLAYVFIKSKFISELTLIIGWVFIGETVCNVLYHRIENRLKITRRKQIINAKFIFNE